MTPHHASGVTRHPREGVALIITLLMLAVITFMAVTFLALSRRQAGAVRVSTDAITAANASYGGVEHVKAELLANILATTNVYNFGMLVSTNYINWLGYNNAQPHDQLNLVTLYWATNVNYAYPNGNPLTGNDARQNLANLLYDAPAPVFVTNRLFANSNDFRFYLDLNRNRRYDTNGYWPALDNAGLPIVTTTNDALGNPVTFTNYSYFVGDPEWRGILARPEFPHSSTNQFVARYAFLVVPTGKTLDVNHIHNQAKQGAVNQDGFLRNQGVGSWEINLAGFLVDLNTNLWLLPPPQGYGTTMTPPYYRYRTGGSSSGAAFEDALALVYYRYATRWDTLFPVSTLFGQAGIDAFNLDRVDGYSHGPIMTNYWGWMLPPDQDKDTSLTASAWPGSDNPRQFFTTQDFFDTAKLPSRPGYDFVERLKIAGTLTSSYDRYTYYRMLGQLGTDSAPEDGNKVNVNYVNVGGLRATNFVSWDDPDLLSGDPARGIPGFGVPGSLLFFSSAANALLTRYTEEWRNENFQAYTNTYGTILPFGVTNIPVWVSNRFVYSPSVHRLLQLAANIYDASTNRTFEPGSRYQFPSVFRPVFRKEGNDVFIAGYTVVDTVSGPGDPRFAVPRELPADLAALLPTDNVYGVPWVIGAKKGLPNFNELATHAVFQITRKLQVTRPSLNAPPSQWSTNMLYVVGLSNVIAVEAWNSYRSNFNRAVDLYVVDNLSMTLTNEVDPSFPPFTSNLTVNLPRVLSIPATGPQQWRGYAVSNPTNSFRIPLQTNVVFQRDAAYQFASRSFTTNWDAAWDKSQKFPLPQWRWAVTNKLRLIMLDRATGRVVDYVQLDGPKTYCDISAEMQKPLEGKPPAFGNLWSTNRVRSGLPEAINNQILVSLGDATAPSTSDDWSEHGIGNPTGRNREFAIDYYRAMYDLGPLFPERWPNGLVNTSLVQQVPFSPTVRVAQYVTWQANDPLVHYTSDDLRSLARTNDVDRPSVREAVKTVGNIGVLNERYQPWGGRPLSGSGQNTPTDPHAFNLAVKDPLMRSSDDWQFPTNKLPNVGWLARVHRGTPWQTVYMKSPEMLSAAGGLGAWAEWTGNGFAHSANATNILLDAVRTAPMADRLLFDVFTAAFYENATRGQLSVNQENLAAWSAVFTGVQTLSNNTTDNVLGMMRLNPALSLTNFTAMPIEPVGTEGTNSPLWKIVEGINRERNRIIGTNSAGEPVYAHHGRSFRHAGDILAVPELSTNSPFLNLASATQLQNGVNDAVYEWLPQQVMGLLRVGEPRFVVYSYGQTLRPARNSLYQGSGPFNGMCTNYQVTAETATRTVLRVEGSPDPRDEYYNPQSPPNPPDPTKRYQLDRSKSYPPRIVVESFNLLPPD